MDAPIVAILEQAIAKRVCLQAVYNKTEVVLAPHSLFTRHEAAYLKAVTVEHGGRKPREPKLGSFKVDGLTRVGLTRKLFSAKSIFPAEAAGAAVTAEDQ